MVSFFGDYDTTETVIIPFNTFDSNDPSASVTITNLAAADVEIHKDGSATQRASDAGVTVSIDFDTVTGNHLVSIDLSDNSDAGFYANGSRYQVRMEGTTVDGATINAWIGAFSIGCTLRPTTAGRTLDVTATGAAGIDWGNVENPTTAVDLSGTDIQLCDTVTTNTDMRGTDSAALASVVGALTDAAAAGDPTTADTLMQYVKQLINILIGTTGVTTFPAEAAPANNVSLAEIIRAIHADVTGLNGDAMRGTDSAALASVCTEARLAELDAANIPSDVDSILTDTGTTLDNHLTDIKGTGFVKDTHSLIDIETYVDLIDDGTSGLAKIATDVAAILVDTGVIGSPAGADIAADIAAIQADTDDIQTRIPAVAPIEGTADSGTTTTMVDAARTEADTDYWKDDWIHFTSGNLAGQTRLITGFTPASDTITFAPATTQAVATHTYRIIPAAQIDRAINVTTNDDMRGTDSAALASVCTEARLAELDAANLPTDVDAILVDTNSLNDTKIPDTISLAAINAEADTALTDYGALKPTTAGRTLDVTATGAAGIDWGNVENPTTAVDLSATDIQLCDTITTYTGNTVQTGDSFARLGAPAGASVSADVAAVQSDTDDIQTRIPAALVGGRIDASAGAVNNNTNAAARLALSAAAMVPGTVDNSAHTPTTTEFEADDITEATADHYNGRIIVFTSGALDGQATDITDYSLSGSNGHFTVTALTEAPGNNDTFIIV